MPSAPEYALMAGNVYRASRDENNRVPVPDGWKELENTYTVTPATGFEAIAYKREGTNEIVISYAGTDPNEFPDWINNVQLGVGLKSKQLLQAADFYQKIKQSNPGADITFTGHSLGGGLAGLMGVFFNKHAEVFDILWGNEGRDRLEGGAGKDWINGGPDDDWIYADKEIPLADALQASAQGSGQPGDWLEGDDWADVIATNDSIWIKAA
jgi:hypothetical protein